MPKTRVLVVGHHENEGTVFIYQSLARTRHKLLAENCKRAAEFVRALPIIHLVIIDEMRPDSFEAAEHNAAWLAEILAREKPDMPVMVITNESPTAILYREAEQAGAVMVAKNGLDREKFLAVVEDLVPRKEE